MVIQNNAILYFSGTGNSLQVAKDINEVLGDSKLFNVATLLTEGTINIEGKVLGIVFPVYYARMPHIVECILEKLVIKADTYVFAIATHGGGPAGTLIKLKKMLQSKGITLNAGFLMHMPGNNIFSYGATSVDKQNKLFDREKRKLLKIAPIVTQRKDNGCEASKLVIDSVIDKVFIKITDKIVSNFATRDTAFWVNDRCNQCRLCERICPVHNIQFNSDRPIWKHNCEQCAACIQYCPKEAIQWGEKTSKRRRYVHPNIKAAEQIKSIEKETTSQE
jgi:Ferredoxin